MAVQYEVYLNGSLSGDEIYFHRKEFVHQPTGAAIPAGVALTSSGVLSTTYPYDWMTSPNLWPAARTPGQLGMTARLSGGVPDRVEPFAFAWYDVPGDLSVTSHFPVRTNTPYTMKLRYFLRSFTVKLQWTDGGTNVPLIGRWMGLGGSDYSFSYYNLSPLDGVSSHYRGSLYGGYSEGSEAYYDSGASPFRFTLTDALGIGTYYGLLGVAIGSDDGMGGYTWELVHPAAYPGGGGAGSTQNVAMWTNKDEHHPLYGDVSYEYPWNLPEDRNWRQWVAGDATPTQKTSGWGINYSTAWNASTGMLTYGAPALQTFSYHQGVKIHTVDNAGTAIPSTVSILAGGGFGPYSGAGGTTIDMLPKGSLLDNVRLQPGDVPGAGPSDPGYIPPLTSIPLVSASAYPTASMAGAPAHLVPPNYTLLTIGIYPECRAGLSFHTTWTGKSSDTLTGVVTIDRPPDWPIPSRGAFDGGEVLTEAYDFTWVATDGSGRHGGGRVWVHEDCYEEIGPPHLPPSTAAGGLDYCVDPAGEPWLTEGQLVRVLQSQGTEMEKTIGWREIIPEGMLSPSRQVLADHMHLLAGIDSGGVANLWTAPDGETFTKQGVIDNSATWKGCCLREEPTGALHCFLVNDSGVVKKRVSADGGTTWGAISTPSGLPTCQLERVDLRHLADGTWLALCGASGGALELYSSNDGDAFSHETQVATQGRNPWILPFEAGDYLTLFHDGTHVTTRRISGGGGSWTIGASVPVDV